jgi:7-keto-8-aminopelargonate synthetase-like enzyme
VQVGTFSKALGGQGGFVAAAPEVIHTLVSRARPLLYSTAPPPAQVAAAREGLRVLQDEPWRRDRLHALAAQLRRRLEELGLGPLPGQGPIVPVVVGSAERALALSRALLRRGVFVPAIRPPTVPPGMSRLRFSLSAAHREADVELAAAALAEALREVES